MSGPVIILQHSTHHFREVLTAAKEYQARWSHLSEPQQSSLRHRVIELRSRNQALLRDLDKLSEAAGKTGAPPIFRAATAAARAYLLRAKQVIDWTYIGVKRTGFVSEADPMHWRPNAKLLADIARSRKMTQRIDARRRQSQAQFSEAQLRALRNARSRYEARARVVATQALQTVLPQAHHHLIPGWIKELAKVFATEAQDIAHDTQKTGDVPGRETVIGRAVKVIAERSGLYSPAGAAMLGAVIEGIYKLNMSAEKQLLASAVAAVLTLAIDRRSGKGDKETGGLLEQLPMELAA